MKVSRNLWPCLGESGLQVFATTADQRYQISKELFLATHFPISLRRFPPECPPEVITETALLDRILNTSSVQPGNRVIVLYGAAGSGKSELLKWLQVMVAHRDPVRAEVTVRIPRTELDVMRIAERFHHLLSDAYFTEKTQRRWTEARQKPRTLSKLLLLTALARCLDDDAQINALYYRLLDWIYPRIARSLDALKDVDPHTDEPVTLLTREDLDELKAETALPMPLDYEPFRHHLLSAFREHLMEGQYLPDTLGRIAEDLAQRGLRPILLIDDLVQSLNLFATDLLDYFITLDSGNWDVILGLTPAALAAGARGRELLDRITYLDTVDDRVEKLWLSDIQGTDSYFLAEETCAAFAGRYLAAYRERNGWSCDACSKQSRCAGLGSGEEGTPLAPFNQALLQRLFRGLPEGKGQARYFLRHLREVLAAASDGGELLGTLKRYAELDTAVEADDEAMARIAELYGPSMSDHRVTLPADLVAAFGEPAEPVTLPAEPLRRQRAPLDLEALSASQPLTDPGRAAIKAWLDGESVNRQSLLPLRKGIARWLRTAQPVRPLHAPGIARPHSVLRWRRVYLSVRPPIVLADVDEGEGIGVTREIGLTAFRLYDLAEATGDERKALIAVLAQEERLLPLLHAAADYHRRVRQRLEEQLGMPIEGLVLALYTWLAIAQGPPPKRPPGFGESFWEQVEETRAQFPVWRDEPDEAVCQSIRYLFDDFFRLRKHVYDGPKITQVIGGRTLEALLDALTAIAPGHVDEDYRLKKTPLCNVLARVQETIQRWRQPRDEDGDLSAAARAVVETLGSDGDRGVLLREVPSEVFSELRERKPELYAALRVVACPPGAEGHAD